MSYGQSPLEKGKLYRIVKDSVVDQLEFQFNPTKYEEELGVDWNLSDSPGQFLPSASFNKIGERTIKMDLLFYGRDGENNVEESRARLELFASPGPDFGIESTQFVSPGRAKLVIGKHPWDVIIPRIKFTHEIMDRQMNTVSLRASLQFTVISTGVQNDVAFLERIRQYAGELSG